MTVFISWVPPSQGFLNVNFDDSVSKGGSCRGVGFIIRDHTATLVAVGDRRIFDTFVVCAVLRAAWEGLSYARQALGADHILLERDSASVIAWVRGQGHAIEERPMLRDICRLLGECRSNQATHVYKKANRADDWIAFLCFTMREDSSVENYS
ncbi:uncharacterized protein LOC103697343 [Phoenix dactylifera]|uniref:Uncharacterized protein LOC103697343 n=1 Tax=Phoenix dactylifera TaxID=42345 RepID=A0A8B7BI83_PHODC|nr:uncharacterized protein LOC103697343 [Phoenix dactylifera]